jgi:hypothetical protein
MQRQISGWRNELSILAEKGTGFDNGKLNRKKKKDDFKNYKVEIIKGIAQMIEALGQKLQTQAHTFKTWEKGKSSLHI